MDSNCFLFLLSLPPVSSVFVVIFYGFVYPLTAYVAIDDVTTFVF